MLNSEEIISFNTPESSYEKESLHFIEWSPHNGSEEEFITAFSNIREKVFIEIQLNHLKYLHDTDRENVLKQEMIKFGSKFLIDIDFLIQRSENLKNDKNLKDLTELKEYITEKGRSI